MPTGVSKPRNGKLISLVDDDEPDIVAKLRTEIAGLLNERANLKNSLYAIECENTDLKLQLREKDFVLKDTQAMLGQYVVAANRPVQADPVAGPSRRPEPSLKRARSPSFEIVVMSEPPRKKGKEKESYPIATPVVTPAVSMTRARSRAIPFVSVPPRKLGIVATPVKSETASLPQHSSSSSKVVKPSPSEQKHRKNEPEPKEEHKSVLEPQSTVKDVAPRRGDKNSPIPVASSRATSPTPSYVSSNPKSQQAKPLVQEDNLKPTATSSESSTGSSTSSSEPDKPNPTSVPPNLQLKEHEVKADVKVKDVFTLPASTIKRYLDSAKALIISPPPLDCEVPRTFLRLAYGGSDQHFLQFIQEDMNPSGPVQRRIVFPMLDMNPAMPSAPGQPGLVFASRHEILSNPPWTLFCKLSNAAPAVWRYLGEYESVLCGTMTAAQFKSQTSVTKLEWAKLILKMKAFDVYVAMRARIALRKAGTIPVEDKEAEEKLVKAEMRAIKNNGGRLLKEKDVIEAFSNGDEGIDIIRMTCVKYDYVFSNDMKAKYDNYDVLVAANKRKKAEKEKSKSKPKKAGGSKKNEASKQPSKKRGRKSKTSIQTEDIDIDEDSEEEEREGDEAGNSDEEYVATSVSSGHELSMRPRRTSRKSAASIVEDGSAEEAFGSPFTDDEDD